MGHYQAIRPGWALSSTELCWGSHEGGLTRKRTEAGGRERQGSPACREKEPDGSATRGQERGTSGHGKGKERLRVTTLKEGKEDFVAAHRQHWHPTPSFELPVRRSCVLKQDRPPQAGFGSVLLRAGGLGCLLQVLLCVKGSETSCNFFLNEQPKLL